MAKFEFCVVPFPLQRSPLQESERSPLPSEAAAELRGVSSAICPINLLNLRACSRRICAGASLLIQHWLCSMRW